MDDKKIVEMIYDNNEEGLRAAEKKYGGLCRSIADNILTQNEDREECVNDAMLALWNNIPPEKPDNLCAYISRLVKNIALKRTRSNNMWKRCANYNSAGEELLDLIPDGKTLAEEYEAKRTGEIINKFLGTLSKRDRDVFVLRYWYRDTVPEVSRRTGLSESLIKSLCERLRKRLREELAKEGIIV